jgi:glycosyltransferase involved in cell wall biosynthesis
VLQEMVNASALLIVQPVTTVSIPAKLYEYMAAGRPVLALAEPGGETAELVRHSGAGLAVPADDEAAIEQAFTRLVNDAPGTFVPVPRSVYDGALRAEDIRKVLSTAIASHHVGRRANVPDVAQRARRGVVTRP